MPAKNLLPLMFATSAKLISCGALLTLILTASLTAQIPVNVTPFGPSPYLSTADSPFYLADLGRSFFIEDFEDGDFNTPGIRLFPGDAVVLPPSEGTDSVDADDGTIDGIGTAGHSLLDTGSFLRFGTSFLRLIDIEFDLDELGFLPTAFGFVWTDGLPETIVGIVSWSASGAVSLNQFPGRVGDTGFNGGTAEDRFFGITRNAGIARVSIRILTEGGDARFEIDHVQYGLLVPEISTSCALVSGLLSIGAFYLGRMKVSV